MPPDPSPPPLMLLLLLLVSTATTPPAASSSNSTAAGIAPVCAPVSCGNSSTTANITYPFWLDTINNQSASYCGYEGLGLTCSNGFPSLRTRYGNYTVQGIDTTTRTLTLADTLTADPTCPSPSHNLSSDLIYSMVVADSNTNITFYFNCNLPTSAPPNYTTCLSQQDLYSFVMAPGDPPPTGATCQNMVVAPVKNSSIPPAGTARVDNWFSAALTQGFEMRWSPPVMEDCKYCEMSWGKCLYSNVTGSGLVFECFCPDGTHHGNCSGGAPDGQGKQSKQINWIVIGSTVGVGFVIGLLFLFTCCLRCSVVRKRNAYLPSLTQLFKMNLDESRAIEVFLEEYKSLELKRYTYSELKKMTKSFSKELGHGGFGKVFKGKLKDGQVVAVKLLNESKGSGQEFINEVTSIGRTNHMNVVRLLGFCSEGLKKALLYEFMPNGSLEKFLSNDISNVTDLIQWEDLYKIVIGVARGLEYLHKGCTTRVVHFDIKPHNILLDEDFNPKISDFGLAKLCPSKASIVSMNVPRGTIGYIAPEVFSRNFGVVSSKSDVYSYGMMVLEMIGLRNHRYVRMQSSDTSAYFPQWIYEKFDENGNLDTYGITKDEHAHEIIKKMILVGLWCIQTNPIERPSMSKVVEMLDGNSKDLEMPPKPYICSPTMSIEEIESIPMI